MSTILTTIAASFVILLLVFAGLGIGVMTGRGAPSGSCGGVAGEGCRLCRKTCRKRPSGSGGIDED